MNTRISHPFMRCVAVLGLATIFGCDRSDDPTAVEETSEALDDEDEATYVGAEARAELGLAAVGDPQGFSFLPFVSDGTAPSTCGTNQVVTGFDCNGGYCDDVAIECHNYGGTLGASTWSAWFEDAGKTFHSCAAGSYVTGIVCRGDNCDDLAVECTVASGALAQTNCQWTPFFSEEDDKFLANIGDAVRGMQCSGTHCDDVRFFVCDTGA